VVLKDVDANKFDTATNVFLHMKQTPAPNDHASILSGSGIPSWKEIRRNLNHIREEYQKLKEQQNSSTK